MARRLRARAGHRQSWQVSYGIGQDARDAAVENGLERCAGDRQKWGERTVDNVLEREINAAGTLQATRIVRGAGGTADQSAIEQAKRMRFEPAKRGGVAIATRMEITVSVPLS